MTDLTTHDTTHTTAHATSTGVLRLHREETGAQSMEYAALAAGGCTIAGLLVALWESDTVQDRVSGLLTGLIDQLSTGIGGLLPF